MNVVLGAGERSTRIANTAFLLPGGIVGIGDASECGAQQRHRQGCDTDQSAPGDVSKRVATVAMAIRGQLTIGDLANADLPYAPPYSLALDHVIVCAHVMENKLRGLMLGVSAAEVKARVDTGAPCFILDTRTPWEFEEQRLGIGETLIPQGALRGRLHELPQDKDREVIVYCAISLRGYECAAILQGHGWRNVKVMEGGVAAWPYPRER